MQGSIKLLVKCHLQNLEDITVIDFLRFMNAKGLAFHRPSSTREIKQDLTSNKKLQQRLEIDRILYYFFSSEVL